MSLPRVTLVLSTLGLSGDFSTIPEDVLNAARDRGTAIHEAIAAHHYDLPFALTPRQQPFFDAYLKFCVEASHAPLVSEYEVVSKRWGYVGHIDRCGWLSIGGFEGRRTIIDYKTGGAKGVEVQLAAYCEAWNEMRPTEPVERACAVALRADGSYRIHPVDITAPMASGASPKQVWYAAMTVYRARQGAKS